MMNSQEKCEPFGVITTQTPEEKMYAAGWENCAAEVEKEVVKVFEEMLQFCKPEEVMLAFNGGKDCTVVLHMLEKFYRQIPLCYYPVIVLYIQCENNFPEVDAFVEYCKSFYPITLLRAEGSSIKEALQNVCCRLPDIKCVVMGSRRTDPYCSTIQTFQKTDPGWPSLIRVSPILDWGCQHVWKYIFTRNVPYCSLYRLGYTSLGATTNTQPNPFLKVMNDNGTIAYYKPAYKLEEDEKERAGRT